MAPLRALLVTLLAAAPLAGAQAGDAKDPPGTVQGAPPAHLEIPPAPPLSPAESLAALDVADGFAVDLVAAEPLVGDPVTATFAPDGALWVVEMRGYMPDADGTGELAPVGVVAVLHDDDGDARADRRVEFATDLVLPRAVLPTRGGALVIAPPDLLFLADTDGDGRADERTVVDTGFVGLDDPEHAPNGLVPTLDDAVACARHDRRYRWSDTERRWVAEATSGGGQWGLAQDDWGDLFFNTNSAALRTDAVPSRYGARNPNHGDVPGTDESCVDDVRVFPARTTPGVNRGYHDGLLDERGRLTRLTSACGPAIERSGAWPEPWAGGAFICEPAAHVVKHYALHDDDGDGHVRGAIVVEGREFLASHDERFRPVDLFGGADDGLYVVDMARGVIQHRTYMTSYLRRQVDARGLASPTGRGRILRIRPADAAPAWPPDLTRADDVELVGHLSHTNGWWRDTAQRVLVERGTLSSDARAALDALVADPAAPPLARVHALWTLAGRGALTAETIVALLDEVPDDDAWLEQVLRAAEPLVAALPGPRPLQPAPPLVATLRDLARADGISPRVRRQVAFTLGAARDAWALPSLAALVTRDDGCATPALRSAVLSGLRDREAAFAARLVGSPAWREPDDGRDVLLSLLARAAVRSGRTDAVDALLATVVGARPWQQLALLDGVLDARPTRGDVRLPVRLAERPAALDDLVAVGDTDVFAAVLEVSSALSWPGRPTPPGVPPPPRPLTDAERASFVRGRAIYASSCAACHRPSGRGAPGLAPPLRDSRWVLGEPDVLVRIVVDGLTGPIDVAGERWDIAMPSLPFSDRDAADVATYVRREWGHGADPVTPEDVARIRAADDGRHGPWTADELSAGTR